MIMLMMSYLQSIFALCKLKNDITISNHSIELMSQILKKKHGDKIQNHKVKGDHDALICMPSHYATMEVQDEAKLCSMAIQKIKNIIVRKDADANKNTNNSHASTSSTSAISGM